MLLRTYLNISLLRADPRDLPPSFGLTALAVSAYVLADVWTLLGTLSFWVSVQASVVDTLLLVALTHTALVLRNATNRTRQTLSALAGCGALLSLLAWGAVGISEYLFSVGDANAAAEFSSVSVAVPFLLWYIVVFGHILRHALSIPFPGGVVVGMLFFVLSAGISGALITGPVLLDN